MAPKPNSSASKANGPAISLSLARPTSRIAWRIKNQPNPPPVPDLPSLVWTKIVFDDTFKPLIIIRLVDYMQFHRVMSSLASYPGWGYLEAMNKLVQDMPVEHHVGQLCFDHVQLCPQNYGWLTEGLVDQLLYDYPDTQFRLHANVRVLPTRLVQDLSDWRHNPEYWKQLAAISRRLGATAYTLHAGQRSAASMTDLYRYASEAEDLFGCPVGIEGHFPFGNNSFLLSTWGEYQDLFESGSRYVVDLSHLNIVARQSGKIESNLVKEMVSSDRCMEIHISENDGVTDSHKRLGSKKPWWIDLLNCAHPSTVIFAEGKIS